MIQSPGEHVPVIKNRSSKQKLLIANFKPRYRSMSNEELVKCNEAAARKELKRRDNKRSKKMSK